MELQKGRPMDTTGRLAKETRTYDLLDRLGIEYNRIDHAPAMTMEACQKLTKRCRRSSAKIFFFVTVRKPRFTC